MNAHCDPIVMIGSERGKCGEEFAAAFRDLIE